MNSCSVSVASTVPTGDQVSKSVVEHLAIGVVGIGEKQESMGLAKDVIKHDAGFVDERPAVAIRKHQSLVDAGANGDTEVVSPYGAENSEGLEGMSHDELRLGVRARPLVEMFHGGHLASLLRVLDSIKNRNGFACDPAHGKELEDGGEPEPGKLVGFDRVAVEEVQDILVVGSIEAKRPDETGHAERIVADGEGDLQVSTALLTAHKQHDNNNNRQPREKGGKETRRHGGSRTHASGKPNQAISEPGGEYR